jgi:hypothetical protein
VLLVVCRVAAAAGAGVAGGLPDYNCVEGFAGCSVFAEAVLQLLAAAFDLPLSLTVTIPAAHTDDSKYVMRGCDNADVYRIYKLHLAVCAMHIDLAVPLPLHTG